MIENTKHVDEMGTILSGTNPTDEQEEKEEKVYDVFGIKYDEKEAETLRLSREVRKEINRFVHGAQDQRLVVRKALLYKNLLKHRIWLDDQITKIEKELAASNCEVYSAEDQSVIIAREVEGSKEKVVFVEPLTYSQASRAQEFYLNKNLKGRNIVV